MTFIKHSSTFDVPAGALFAFHADVANLARIAPPLTRFQLLSTPKPTELNDVQVFRLGVGPLKTTWRARISRFTPGVLIEDVQESGPFLRWRHQHQVTANGDRSRLTDTVSFRLIPTPAGEALEWFLIRPALLLMFVWRHRKTATTLQHQRSSS